ncbi:MAG: NADP-reducing hydrogenase subunit HndC [Syntrophomonadaceae bacterium]|nr:NADP-reducing hydrogenase subunit HndC [Bacillota bacterium]
MTRSRKIFICQGTGCLSSNSYLVYEALKAEVAALALDGVEVDYTGCHGFCEQGPIAIVEPEGIFYTKIQAEDAAEIAASHLRDDKPVERLFYREPLTGKAVPYHDEVTFYKEQERVILYRCGRINPEKIDDYLEMQGYQALRKAVLELTPQGVIDEISQAGLRGRGGAGFPTSKKWEFCRNALREKKYVICNADEGDPGAFMDRSILEADPHAVVEGLTLAGYATGASEGYIYVRAEYPLAVRRVRIAISQAEERGFLGSRILGSDFNFKIQIKEGAGSFVCGEETALIASIESRRGMPRPRPPFPAQSGLDGKPTIINNVKTLAAATAVIGRGAGWFENVGTEKSRGTAVFALTGKISNSGLVEVPMGTPLSKIIFKIGGGIPRGRRFKAVQTGGPSGGCIPARYLDSPVEYESLAKLGSIMGSGGMVVMDESTCMVDIARYFLSFTQSESCGKCTPCRLGTKQMLEILTRITQGKGRDTDIDTLLSIAKTVKEGSLCGLGQTCPNPVLTTLKYFREEYESHIREKKCPAAICDALMVSPCQHTCPAGIDVPRYLAHIAEGEYLKAVETIRERNPFPAICGRICNHPCEARCRRGELDEPVSIRSLKRFAADWYFDNSAELPEPEPFPRLHPQSVAVVGAGPCGLTCAYFLTRFGYRVTVFEALPVGGGMLSVALPEFRLPREVIEKEIDYIVKRGVEIRYNTPVNTGMTVEDLRKSGYDAVFIAAGAQRSQRVGIPGEIEDLDGFYYGLRFLRDVKIGRNVKIGRRAIVIGGGNVALDTARTAIRLGAEEVTILYRRTREEMPASEAEYEEALAEGLKIEFLVSPTRIVNENWKVTGLQCTRMVLGEPGADGRRRPVPIPGSEFFMQADTIFAAVGQAPDLSFLPPDSALERTRWETLVVDDNRLSANLAGIFAGGDFITGPGMLIDAVAAGRRGAMSIDKYFRGDKSRVRMYDMKISNGTAIRQEDSESEEETWQPQFRPKMAYLSVEERKKSFLETELGFSEEEAREEPKRCLRCDLES